MKPSQLRSLRAAHSTRLRESRGFRNQRSVSQRIRWDEILAQYRDSSRLRAIPAGSIVRGAPSERRSSGGNGSHLYGRRGSGAYDANLRQARLSRLGLGRLLMEASIKRCARAIFTRCRSPLPQQMQRRWSSTSDWDSERSKLSQRACGRREARYLRARSFSKPFSSSMNSFTSLKSR